MDFNLREQHKIIGENTKDRQWAEQILDHVPKVSEEYYHVVSKQDASLEMDWKRLQNMC